MRKEGKQKAKRRKRPSKTKEKTKKKKRKLRSQKCDTFLTHPRLNVGAEFVNEARKCSGVVAEREYDGEEDGSGFAVCCVGDNDNDAAFEEHFCDSVGFVPCRILT
jgi:hypothetical protein